MAILVASPSTGMYAQQVALAFHERGELAAFLTGLAYHEDSALARLVAAMPPSIGGRLGPQLARRAVTSLPAGIVEERPFWEVVRTLASRAGASETVSDRLWDRFCRTFTAAAARRVTQGASAIYAYEYAALEAFAAARSRGLPRILDLPSLDSRQFEMLQRQEKERFPELKGRNESYFAARFEQRQARRDAEIASADVIITNSSVTRRSHVAAGADPEKTFVVNLGAPPPVATLRPARLNGRLRVVWAGSFSLRKGAQYLVEALRKFPDASSAVTLNVYGSIGVPQRVLADLKGDVVFHGSVPQAQLFAAFDDADVLMFPTLSDGFGMVVTEAFARALPVITTDRAGASDLVVHERNGLIIPAADADAIGGALAWCLDNRGRLEAMRKPARDAAAAWQWPDYRRALADAVSVGFARAGYAPPFGQARLEPAA